MPMTDSAPRRLVLGWLYGAKMNIYGDRGNVLALAQRAAWRGEFNGSSAAHSQQ